MNLCRLLIAVSLVCPREQGESSLKYNRRVLLIAVAVIEAITLYKQMGERYTSGSDLQINEVLQKYHTLTKKLKKNYEPIR
jgi:hypothetical protein